MTNIPGDLMGADSISKALLRQQERPDLHKKVTGVKRGASYPQDVINMVQDLKEHVPDLSLRQLSTLVGIGCKGIRNILDSTVPDERWSEEDNPASTAAELAALREHHDRYRDGVTYTLFDGRVADIDEWQDTPILFTAPLPADTYRRADQSHTFKRPITLATRPFEVAA